MIKIIRQLFINNFHGYLRVCCHEHRLIYGYMLKHGFFNYKKENIAVSQNIEAVLKNTMNKNCFVLKHFVSKFYRHMSLLQN